MKAIIYAGIGLFSAASVYGIVDYYNDSHKGKLKDLYREEEITDKPQTENRENIAELNNKVISGEKKPATTVLQKKKTKKNTVKKINLDDFSRGKIMPPEIIREEITPEIIEAPVVRPIPEVLAKAVAFPEKKEEVPVAEERRKISLENFSRAPLKYKKNLKKSKE